MKKREKNGFIDIFGTASTYEAIKGDSERSKHGQSNYKRV